MALSWDSVCLKLFVHHRQRLSGMGEGLNGINKDKTSSKAFVRVSHIFRRYWKHCMWSNHCSWCQTEVGRIQPTLWIPRTWISCVKLTAGRGHLGVHFPQLFVLVQFTFYTWAVQGIGQKTGNCKRDTHTEGRDRGLHVWSLSSWRLTILHGTTHCLWVDGEHFVWDHHRQYQWWKMSMRKGGKVRT